MFVFGLQFVGTDVVNKVQANKFQLVVTEGKKVKFFYYKNIEQSIQLQFKNAFGMKTEKWRAITL